MLSLKKYLLNLNIFAVSDDSGEREDEQQRRSNIIATRVYVLILTLVLVDVALISWMSSERTMMTIEHPTRQQFEALPIEAKCPCSRVSILYEEFISINATFHQVCLSDFVSDGWITTADFGPSSTYYLPIDFRAMGSAQFQALAGFCRLSKSNVAQSISSFFQTTLVSSEALTETDFRSQTEALINQFQRTAPDTFIFQLRLVREMIHSTKLFSALQTNYHLY